MMMEFISRVVTTSSTFNLAFSNAGMSAQSMPLRKPSTSIMGMTTIEGRVVNVAPTQAAATAPA